jgi:ParB-like chromosome segregation protein Spo0J
MTDKQADDLRESIKRFGLVDPLIANSSKGRENILIGGHQRLAIAKELGFETVPVVFVELDEARERELNLRLNKNVGEWDWDLLAGFEIEELLEVGFDKREVDAKFNVEMAGKEYLDAEKFAHKCPACGHEYD